MSFIGRDLAARAARFVVALLITTGVARAAVVNYGFSGAVGSEASLPPDAPPPHAAAGNMARNGVTGNGDSGWMSATNWPVAPSALDANKRLGFTITPSVGFRLNMASLLLDERRSGAGASGAGPRSWAVRSNVDAFGSNISTFSIPDDKNTRTNQTTTLGGVFADRTVATEFRIFAWDAENTTNGSWSIRNVKLNYTATGAGPVDSGAQGANKGTANVAAGMLSNVAVGPAASAGNININGHAATTVDVLLDVTDDAKIPDVVSVLSGLAGVSVSTTHPLLAAYSFVADYDLLVSYSRPGSDGAFIYNWDFASVSGVTVANVGVNPEPRGAIVLGLAIALTMLRPRLRWCRARR